MTVYRLSFCIFTFLSKFSWIKLRQGWIPKTKKIGCHYERGSKLGPRKLQNQLLFFCFAVKIFMKITLSLLCKWNTRFLFLTCWLKFSFFFFLFVTKTPRVWPSNFPNLKRWRMMAVSRHNSRTDIVRFSFQTTLIAIDSELIFLEDNFF